MKLFFNIILIFSSAIVFTNDWKTSYQIIEDKSEIKILTPLLAERKTAKIILKNGLHAYIISDKNATKSSASLSVNVGSWNDPTDYPGMAHFLEHMLFQGTKAYPNESEYHKYITENEGIANAYTAETKTVYSFSINTNHFFEALDRFSHFLIDPLLDPSCIDKELHAVDQEYSLLLENDTWRWLHVVKELSDKNHPMHHFPVGNAEILSKIPYEKLKKWFQDKYSSNIMNLFVYSSLPLDELVEQTVKKFQRIPNKNLTPLSVTQPFSSEKQKAHFHYIKPVISKKKMILLWELPYKFFEDKSQAISLVSYILNHGHDKGILYKLKQKQLIESLNADYDILSKNNILFLIEVNLTNKGLSNTNEIIENIFANISNLKKSNIPSYLFDEMKTIHTLNYQYQSQVDAFEYAQNNAASMIYENLSTYPRNLLIPEKFSSSNVRDLLNNLNPKECQYYIVADNPEINYTTREKWFGSEYTSKEISSSLLEDWENITNPNIELPNPNHFIPTDLSLKTISQNESTLENPIQIANNEKGNIFYGYDNLFNIPKINYIFSIKSPLFDSSSKSIILKNLLIFAFKHKLISTASYGNEAGFDIDIDPAQYCIIISINGYSDKSSLLLQEILKAFRDNSYIEEEFNIFKESFHKILENRNKDFLYIQASIMANNLLNNIPSNEDLIATLNSINYHDFLSYCNNVFDKTFIEGMISGNITTKEAESLWLDVVDTFPSNNAFLPKDHYKEKSFSFPSYGGPFQIVKNINMQGTCTLLAIDEGSFSFKKRAAQEILSTALSEAFFSELRTNQKTGYVARSWPLEINRNLYQMFIVQSNSYESNDLLSRFEIFIEDYQNSLPKLISNETFENIKENLIIKQKQPSKNLQEASEKIFSLAFYYDQDFNWYKKRIEGLTTLTYDEFIEFSQNHLSKTNKKRVALLIKGNLPLERQFNYSSITLDKLLPLGAYKSSEENISLNKD